jgi:hypothetical protein
LSAVGASLHDHAQESDDEEVEIEVISEGVASSRHGQAHENVPHVIGGMMRDHLSTEKLIMNGEEHSAPVNRFSRAAPLGQAGNNQLATLPGECLMSETGLEAQQVHMAMDDGDMLQHMGLGEMICHGCPLWCGC